MPPIRLLIAEDHTIVRQGLKTIFSQADDITVVAEAADGEQTVALFRQHQPDVAIIDLRMPKLEGVDAIAQIRQEYSTARLLILTTYDTDEDIYRGLSAGASGYLLKGTTAEELVSAVYTVYEGRKYIPSEVAAKLAERLNSNELTDREIEVLRLLAKGKNNLEIGEQLTITEGTVKFHLNNIFSKLQVKDRAQAVIVALRRGLVRME
jgi:two-component system, NarL family, response regulator